MEKKNNDLRIWRTASLVSLLLVSLLLVSDAFTQSYYGRFSDEKRVLHLIRSDNQMSAVLYQFHEADSLRKIELGGAVVSNERFSIKAYRMEGYRFEGVFSDNHNHLRLSDESGNNLNLLKAYPVGSMQLDYYYDYSSKALVASGSNASRAISELGILMPQVIESNGLREHFNAFYGLLAPKSNGAESLIRAEQNRFFDQYVSMNKDLADRVESLNWERSQQMRVLLNGHGLLCLEKASYAYTGGAHGLARMQYLLIDIEKQRPIDLPSVFDNDKLHELIALMNKKVREQYEIDDGVGLQEFGLFVDEMPLTDNIYLEPQGIGFYYNHYDIGPYAMGHTHLFFSFDELFHLLKTQSPVYSFAQKMMHL